MATRKTVDLSKRGIAKLPNDKPAVYSIETQGGRTNYIGLAKRGRVVDRITEHLPNAKDPIPGAKVTIEQKRSMDHTRTAERLRIARERPRYNKQGK